MVQPQNQMWAARLRGGALGAQPIQSRCVYTATAGGGAGVFMEEVAFSPDSVLEWPLQRAGSQLLRRASGDTATLQALRERLDTGGRQARLVHMSRATAGLILAARAAILPCCRRCASAWTPTDAWRDPCIYLGPRCGWIRPLVQQHHCLAATARLPRHCGA